MSDRMEKELPLLYIDTAGTDVSWYSVPSKRTFVLRTLVITNTASSDAQVTIKIEFTPEGSTTAETIDKMVIIVPASSTLVLRNLAVELFGSIKVNSNAAGVYVMGYGEERY